MIAHVPRLTELPRPFIVCVVTDVGPTAALQTIRRGVPDGATAFELNLPALPGADISGLAAEAPVYTSCRRRDFMAVYGFEPSSLPDWPDDERMARQLAACRAGAVAIDVELDAFDPRPDELTTDRAAVERQRQVVQAAHALGAEVIASCHTGSSRSADELVAIGRAAAERGADLLKIVTPSSVATVVAASDRLRTEVRLPFTLIASGPDGRITRLAAPAFGSSYVIGRAGTGRHEFEGQPLVSQLRDAMALLA